MYERWSSLPRTLSILGLSAALALLPQLSHAQEPPPGDSRLGHLQGNVSIQPAGIDSWGLADPNLPVNPGDRLFADPQSGAQGELQAGPVRAYFGPGADLTLTDFSNQGVELGIASGVAYFMSDGFEQGQSLYVSTPNGGVLLSGRGGFRVDVYQEQQSTVITNLQGGAPIQINGAGNFSTSLQRNESIQLTGTNPVYAQALYPAPPDSFQHWALAIESQHQNAISLRYVNPGMIGYSDLDRAGDWQPDSPYGPVWFPHVDTGWAPYRYGHWVNRPFYGWVWVADEPWGTAPFHYGRWVTINGRWGWIPGPREVRPVWSPAQVVFAAGVQVGGAGLSVWFPLGPGEPYKPWYPCSPRYIDQVNISNIHPAPRVVVHNTYVNVVNVTNVTNITYVNRTVGVTAVHQQDFAAGHATRAAIVKIDPRQIEHVQVAAAPAVRPPAQPVLIHPVARPVAVQPQRPVLINHQGQQVTAVANAKPVAVPVKAAPPAPRPLPGRQAAGNPTLGGKPVAPAPAAAGKPGNAPAPTLRPNQPAAPVAVPAKPNQQPVQQPPTHLQPAAPAPRTPVQAPPAQRPTAQPAPANQPEKMPAHPAPAPAPAPARPTAAPAAKAPEPPQRQPEPAPRQPQPAQRQPLPPARMQPAPAVNPPAARPLPPGQKPDSRDAKKGEHPKDDKKPQPKPE